MRGANLADARLGPPEPGNELKTPQQTDLAGALLISANLRRADLHQVNLSFADLTGADLTDANLAGADLSRAVSVGPTWHKLIWRMPISTAPSYRLHVGSILHEDWGTRAIATRQFFDLDSMSTSLP